MMLGRDLSAARFSTFGSHDQSGECGEPGESADDAAEIEVGGLVAEFKAVPAGRDHAGAEQMVGAVDGGGDTVDGGAPAGVEYVV